MIPGKYILLTTNIFKKIFYNLKKNICLLFNRPPVVVNTEKVEKGQSIMDALLGMFTTKVNAEPKKGIIKYEF